LFTTAGIFILPNLAEQLREFMQDFPSYYRSALELWASVQREYAGWTMPAWFDQVTASLEASVAASATAWSRSIAEWLVGAGSQLFGLVLYFVLALVVGFWVLKDLPAMREEALLLAGPRRRSDAALVYRKISDILGGYLRGQVIISVVTGVLVWLGLALLDVPYAGVIGFITGVLNVVPYLGPFVGGVIAAISAAFISPLLALWAVLVVVGAQQFTDIVVTPRIMSEQVDLHPVLVIFSLLAGGTLFGFVGLLMAIPVAAIAKGLFVHYFEKYTDSELSREDGALFKAKVEECAEDDVECVEDEAEDAVIAEDAHEAAERGAHRLIDQTKDDPEPRDGD
jgi:predicted PurR-regulated permease PerM